MLEESRNGHYAFALNVRGRSVVLRRMQFPIARNILFISEQGPYGCGVPCGDGSEKGYFETIEALKVRICEKNSVPPRCQDLWLFNRSLEDYETVGDTILRCKPRDDQTVLLKIDQTWLVKQPLWTQQQEQEQQQEDFLYDEFVKNYNEQAQAAALSIAAAPQTLKVEQSRERPSRTSQKSQRRPQMEEHFSHPLHYRQQHQQQHDQYQLQWNDELEWERQEVVRRWQQQEQVRIAYEEQQQQQQYQQEEQRRQEQYWHQHQQQQYQQQRQAMTVMNSYESDDQRSNGVYVDDHGVHHYSQEPRFVPQPPKFQYQPEAMNYPFHPQAALESQYMNPGPLPPAHSHPFPSQHPLAEVSWIDPNQRGRSKFSKPRGKQGKGKRYGKKAERGVTANHPLVYF